MNCRDLPKVIQLLKGRSGIQIQGSKAANTTALITLSSNQLAHGRPTPPRAGVQQLSHLILTTDLTGRSHSPRFAAE